MNSPLLRSSLLALSLVTIGACSSPDPGSSSSLYGHRPQSTGSGNAGTGGGGTSSGGSGSNGATGGGGNGGGGNTGGNTGGTGGNNGGNTGGGTGGNTGGGTGGEPFKPAAHPALPQMVSSGGTVMKAPRAIPIFFANDALQSQIVSFVSAVGATDYWKANTAEYGVGALTGAPAVVLNQTAPQSITDQGIQTIIANAIASGQLPQPSTNQLYTIFFPLTSTITAGQDKSCSQFGGYHSEGRTNGGQSFIYAVIPRCANFNNLTGIDMVTVATSHEFIEAATDPLVATAPAYQQPDQDHAIWGIVFTSESGDMCAQNPNVNTKVPGLDFMVQKSWSNVAANANHDPCAPNLPGQVYFNSAPALDDTISVTLQGQTFTTKGVKIANGASKTIDLSLYSDAPTSGPWTIKVLDLVGLQSGTPLMDTQLSATQGQNGDHVKLTITLKGVDSQLRAAPFLIESTLGDQTNFWMGAAAN